MERGGLAARVMGKHGITTAMVTGSLVAKIPNVLNGMRTGRSLVSRGRGLRLGSIVVLRMS